MTLPTIFFCSLCHALFCRNDDRIRNIYIFCYVKPVAYFTVTASRSRRGVFDREWTIHDRRPNQNGITFALVYFRLNYRSGNSIVMARPHTFDGQLKKLDRQSRPRRRTDL